MPEGRMNRPKATSAGLYRQLAVAGDKTKKFAVQPHKTWMHGAMTNNAGSSQAGSSTQQETPIQAIAGSTVDGIIGSVNVLINVDCVAPLPPALPTQGEEEEDATNATLRTFARHPDPVAGYVPGASTRASVAVAAFARHRNDDLSFHDEENEAGEDDTQNVEPIKSDNAGVGGGSNNLYINTRNGFPHIPVLRTGEVINAKNTCRNNSVVPALVPAIAVAVFGEKFRENRSPTRI